MEKREKRLFDRKRVLYDVGNLAFVVADVREDKHSAHSLHQTFDILESGNIDRVNGILDLASAEVGVLLNRHIQSGATCKVNSPEDRLKRELVHQFLVARVLADWLSITLPEAAGVWKEKAAEAFDALAASLRGRVTVTRRVPPI